MNKRYLLRNAHIINETEEFTGYVQILDDIIEKVGKGDIPVAADVISIDLQGKLLMPGVIDCHVHFREPGLTHKADMASESRAAVAGGVTSFMEMPNTIPQTTTLELLEQKMELALKHSLANYSFFLGAGNDNISEIVKVDPKKVCGVKVFFGASTGNMLVDKLEALEDIFRLSPIPVAAHCEDEATIRANSEAMKARYGEHVPVQMHPTIRSEEACFRSAELAVSLAKKYNTRLHITHISTQQELNLLDNRLPISQKRITAETCPHYLLFSAEDYARLGTLLKINPAVKTARDKQALLKGLTEGNIDIISTDHAPHLMQEKQNTYFKAPSGTPLVQFSLLSMLKLFRQHNLPLTLLVEKMCHTPAICYSVEKRGFIREGYFADLVVVNAQKTFRVEKKNILSKCGWSVFEGETFTDTVEMTFVNGHLAYSHGEINDAQQGMRLTFNR